MLTAAIKTPTRRCDPGRLATIYTISHGTGVSRGNLLATNSLGNMLHTPDLEDSQ